MADKAGRQSPSPSEATGKQQNDPTANAKGVSSGSDNKEQSKSQLDGLESNPKGPLDDHLKDMFKKTVDPKDARK